MREKLIVWIIVFILILSAIYFLHTYLEKNKFSNTPIEGIPEELINTEQEAIDFAKDVEEIKEYAEPLDKGCEPTFSSRYDTTKGT
jgi:hypothetical protein